MATGGGSEGSSVLVTTAVFIAVSAGTFLVGLVPAMFVSDVRTADVIWFAHEVRWSAVAGGLDSSKTLSDAGNTPAVVVTVAAPSAIGRKNRLPTASVETSRTSKYGSRGSCWALLDGDQSPAAREVITGRNALLAAAETPSVLPKSAPHSGAEPFRGFSALLPSVLLAAGERGDGGARCCCR